MRIKVYEPGEKKINIIIPTCLLLNPLSALISIAAIKKYTDEVKLTYSQFMKLARAIKQAKKKYGRSWTIVEVNAADGTEVNITV